MDHRYGRSDSNVKPLNLPNRILASSVLVLNLLASAGCQIVQHGNLPLLNASCDAQVLAEPCVPRELDKATIPMYRVEAPDILSIDVAQNVSQASYPLQIGDVVGLSVMGTFPDEPIAGEYLIESSGSIDLGFSYGSVEVAGRTAAEAINLVETHLRDQLRDPQVSLSLRSMAAMQRIAGEHIVGPDGTITLGQYGSVPVVGMTLQEIRLTIADHLSEFFANPQVSVSVFAYNSKAYYIVTQGGGLGDSLVRLPYTGNETVLDALSQINGMSYVSSSQMWLARPNRQCGTSLQLPIDWEAITQRADVGTNYQLLPGDRLYIAENRLVRFDTCIAQLTSPFERILGFTLLGTGTAARLSGNVLDAKNFGYSGN
jgi:polysaccharide export outer membrane protein